MVAELDPGLPVGAVAHVQSRMAGSLGSTRAVGAVAGLFAALALLVATGLLTLSASVLVAAALVASWWPARRASRVEAARSLRDAG